MEEGGDDKRERERGDEKKRRRDREEFGINRKRVGPSGIGQQERRVEAS